MSDFSLALTALRAGKPVRRRDWATQLEILPANKYEITTFVDADGIPKDRTRFLPEHFVIRFPNDQVISTVLDTTDLLADDWEVL